ncbi:hypothetical protein AAMO2058_000800100 [Amorphochlora amoebiformis]
MEEIFNLVSIEPIATGLDGVDEKKKDENSAGERGEGMEVEKTDSKSELKRRLESMVRLVVELNAPHGVKSAEGWKLLIRVITNVISEPNNPKFRKLPLNGKVTSKLSKLDGSLDLSHELGFKQATLDKGKRYLILSEDTTSLDALKYARDLFTAALMEITPGPKPSTIPTERKTSGKLHPIVREGKSGFPPKKSKISKDLRQKLKLQKQKAARESALRRKISPSAMADIIQRRLKGEKSQSSGVIRKGRVADFDRVKRIRSEIDQIRASKNREWRRTKMSQKRVYTVRDLEEMAKKRSDVHAKFGNKNELDKIGQEALKFTNEFRAKHGKPPLSWHQKLCDIGKVHSKDMGDGKVPFSHVGFKERVKQYPMAHRAAAENLAMNAGIPEPEVARAAVNGWIDSPGHRKNLLSNQTVCGIGVYKNSGGRYYLTQLFALT